MSPEPDGLGTGCGPEISAEARSNTVEAERSPERRRLAKVMGSLLAGLVVTLALFIAGYKALYGGGLEQSAALFIGLPAVLAVTLVLTVETKSCTSAILVGTSLALLVSLMALGEGAVCVLIAAPIFYSVALVAGLTLDALDVGPALLGLIGSDGEQAPDRDPRALGLVLLPLMLLSLEGVTPHTSLPRDETVVVRRVVAATPAAVERALARAPDIATPEARFLRLGFPRPVATGGAGLKVGARRTVRFADGAATFAITDVGPDHVRFATVSDTSPIAHWLAWQAAEVRWSATADGRTRVTWTAHYRRLLDPAWYFGPLERYAVTLTGEQWLRTLGPLADDVPHAAQ